MSVRRSPRLAEKKNKEEAKALAVSEKGGLAAGLVRLFTSCKRRRKPRQSSIACTLPSRLVALLLSFLQPEELANAQLVCSQWRLPPSLVGNLLYNIGCELLDRSSNGSLDRSLRETLDKRAMRLFGAAAHRHHARAFYELGVMHNSGRGVPQNPAAAAMYFQCSAKLGYPHAQLISGLQQDPQAPGQDRKTPAEQYAEAAENGDAGAQYKLARSLAVGEGVPQDVGKAAELYRAAADKGHVAAQYALGVLTWQGTGVVQNLEAARALFETAAAAGHAAAGCNLGFLCQWGRGGPRDVQRSVHLYCEAAAAGDVKASALLGAMYLHGAGVPKSESRALGLFRAAAAGGSSQGQLYLAWCYENGFCGLQRDEKKAVELYREAAGTNSQALNPAVLHLARLGLRALPHAGAVAPVDVLQREAAEGFSDAQITLAWLYETGLLGVEKDLETAVECYSEAAMQGAVWAVRRLQQLAWQSDYPPALAALHRLRNIELGSQLKRRTEELRHAQERADRTGAALEWVVGQKERLQHEMRQQAAEARAKELGLVAATGRLQRDKAEQAAAFAVKEQGLQADIGAAKEEAKKANEKKEDFQQLFHFVQGKLTAAEGKLTAAEREADKMRGLNLAGVSDADLQRLQMGTEEALQRLLAEQAARAARKCTSCVEDQANCIILPCGHAGYCVQCAGQCNRCPACRGPIASRQRVYFS